MHKKYNHKWKIQIMVFVFGISFLHIQTASAQVSCTSDSDCEALGSGMRCDQQTHECASSMSTPPQNQTENTVCYIASSKTCSQTETNCSQPNQPFDSLAQCDSFKQTQANQTTQDTAADVPVIGCREGQDCVSLTNPLAETDIKKIVGNSIQIIMGIVGSITFVVFLYGGVLWLTSAGNSERIQKGLQAMLWAGIGIIVIFSSYAIITLILTTLQASPN